MPKRKVGVYQGKMVVSSKRRKTQKRYKRYKKPLQPDVERLDWNLGSSIGSITNSGQWLHVTNMDESTLDRVGNDINVVGFQMRFSLLYGDTYNQVRIIVLRMNVGTSAPTWGEVTIDSGSAQNALRNANYYRKYKVYYDRTFNLVGTTKPLAHVEYRRRTNFKVRYTGSAGTSYSENTLWIGVMSDSGGAPNPSIYSGGFFRLLYTS